MANPSHLSFQTPGYEDLELSTQILIKEALQREINVEVLDRKQNFIALSKNGKTEYIKQATRTSKDSYIAALVMENKEVTKNILQKNGIRIPNGSIYCTALEAIVAIPKYLNKDIVIKPNNTNFGQGVSILKAPQSKADYEKAIALAFNYDDSIIIECFIPGDEFRFLIIDNEVIAVLHRIAANVRGDGQHSIRELVEKKNQNPIRGKGYVKPLEKLSLNQTELKFLSNQSLTPNSIPANNEVIYLRENSNISTGGDSIDFTDKIIKPYHEIAVAAANSVGAKICGADIIIRDIRSIPDSSNYAVIELNFNPALHIHNFPFEGINRQVEKKVIKLLGF